MNGLNGPQSGNGDNMKKAIFILTLAIIMMFSLSSCSKEGAASPEPSGTAPTQSQEPAESPDMPSEPPASPDVPQENAAVSVDENVFDNEYELDLENGQKVKGDLFISVPRLTSEVYQKNADSINDYFEELKESYRQGFEEELEISDYEADREEIPRYMDVSFRTEYNRGNIISFSFSVVTYSGGAHDMITLKSDTFDLGEGVRITADDLFTVNEETYSRRLKDLILQQIDEQSGSDSMFFYEDYDELVEQTFDKENFVLTEEGLCIYFQVYDLAPYAAGTIRFTIPYETIADILDPRFGAGAV